MSEAAHLAILVVAAWLGYVIGWMHGRDGK
jgi:hypothetical protein